MNVQINVHKYINNAESVVKPIEKRTYLGILLECKKC